MFIRSRRTIVVTYKEANKINTDTNTKSAVIEKSAIIKKQVVVFQFAMTLTASIGGNAKFYAQFNCIVFVLLPYTLYCLTEI